MTESNVEAEPMPSLEHTHRIDDAGLFSILDASPYCEFHSHEEPESLIIEEQESAAGTTVPENTKQLVSTLCHIYSSEVCHNVDNRVFILDTKEGSFGHGGTHQEISSLFCPKFTDSMRTTSKEDPLFNCPSLKHFFTKKINEYIKSGAKALMLDTAAHASIVGSPEFQEHLADDYAMQLANPSRFQMLETVMHVLLHHKYTDLADGIINHLKETGSDVASSLVTTTVINMFIRALIEHSQGQNMAKVFQWYISMQQQYNARPDIYTFAFMLYHYRRHTETISGNLSFILEDFHRYGFTIDDIKQTGIYSPEELQNLALLTGGCQLDTDHDCDASQSRINDSAHDVKTQIQTAAGKTEEIHPMQVYGTTLIKKSLRSFDDASLLENAYYLQQGLEQDCYDVSKERWITGVKTMTKIHGLGRIQAIASLFDHWIKQLTRLISDSKETTKTYNDSDKEMHKLCSTLSPERIARITLMNFLRVAHYSQQLNGIIFTRLCIEIGDALERELFATTISKNPFLSKTGLKYAQIQSAFQSEKLLNISMRKVYRKLEHDKEAMEAGWATKLTQRSKVIIGGWLANLVLSHAYIDRNAFQFIPGAGLNSKKPVIEDVQASPHDKQSIEPPPSSIEKAFLHEIIQVKAKKLGIVRMHPIIYDSIMFAPNNPFVSPMALPMVVPPKLWLSYSSGGYLNHRSICVRMKEDPLQLSYIKLACQEGKLNAILTGLDVLGKTAWRIHERILSVLTTAWNENLPLPDIPIAPSTSFEFRSKKEFATDEEFKQYIAHAKSLCDEKRNIHSQRCDTFYKLEIAKRFSNWTLYFPHNVDFRGRAYPIPTHFHHLGNDICRGLLRFEKGKPLEASGLRWLKIHLANLHGFDKAPLEQRVAYTMSHIEDIMDSADEPLTKLQTADGQSVYDANNQKWWTKAEDPWQCLAACMELTNALRHPVPEQYVSHLSIHQDGSCNGLQHYAALGRDIIGASKVNLEPGDKPQDIYAAVAEGIESFLEKDMQMPPNSDADPAKGDPSVLTRYEMAKNLHGKITRKIVKQPVMTTVYGVTLYGAKKQIETKLRELKELNIPGEKIPAYSLYLARLVFQSLGTIFDKARAIQSWLAETAHEIVSSVPIHFATKYGYTESAGPMSTADPVVKEEDEDIIENDIDQSHDQYVCMNSYNHTTLMRAKLQVWNPVKYSVSHASTHAEKPGKRKRSKESSNIDTGNDLHSDATASMDTDLNLNQIPRAKKRSAPTEDYFPQTILKWTTPIGFPVVQPYRAYQDVVVRTTMQSVLLHLHAEKPTPVTVSKQVAGFPPNFIHSLDACHMFMTAIACYEKGLTFASVHDSYWTHAADVDAMSAILRERFVELHEMPILENLRQEFIQMFQEYKIPILYPVHGGSNALSDADARAQKKRGWKDVCIPPLPSVGDFQLKNVLNSRYFFN